ncbi:MAG: SDR family oxidoreductase [Acidimicrobiia bacterium]
MGEADKIRFDGKRVLVVGGASGMGKAASLLVKELGGWVSVADIQDAPHADQSIKVDLRDSASIDAALKQVDGPIHALLSCAGVADGMAGLMKINFLGQRYIIEELIATGKLGRGSAISAISSIGGFGWEKNMAVIDEILATPSYDAGAKWVDAHPEWDNYTFSKQVMNAYASQQGARLLINNGIRFNTIAPGPTMTPLMDAQDVWKQFEMGFRATMNTPGSTAEQQAWPLVFLASDAASFINGTVLTVDAGFVGAGYTKSIDSPMFDAVLGQWL